LKENSEAIADEFGRCGVQRFAGSEQGEDSPKLREIVEMGRAASVMPVPIPPTNLVA